jgi:hypothetical protein
LILETRADPAVDIAAIAFFKETAKALPARIRELESGSVIMGRPLFRPFPFSGWRLRWLQDLGVQLLQPVELREPLL